MNCYTGENVQDVLLGILCNIFVTLILFLNSVDVCIFQKTRFCLQEPWKIENNPRLKIIFASVRQWNEGPILIMFFSLYISATAEDYKLLEEMNKVTVTKYEEMKQIAINISKSLHVMNEKCECIM